MQTLIANSPVDTRVQAEPVPNVQVQAKAPAQETKPEKKQADSHELAKLRTALAQHDISLKFSKDEMTNRLVVQMIDGRTGEAIRQFPTEVSLNLAANFLKLQGVFLDVDR